MTDDRETQSITADGHFGLLDAIVVIAEAWKLLIIACILAAVASFGYFQTQPNVYESKAVVALDPIQLARFSSPDFLKRTGVDNAMWNLELSHVDPGAGLPTRPYDVSFRASSPESAQVGLAAVIGAFTAETTPDSTQTEILQRSKARILKALDDLDLISSQLAGEAESTMPGSESELYARSVVMLLDQQAKREEELMDVELKLKGSGSIVISPPSLPTAGIPRSARAVVIASVSSAVFLVLGFAFSAEAIRRAGRTPIGARKLLRLRQAFGLRRR